MKGSAEYYQEQLDREWRREHPIRFALYWLGILAMCAWCLYTGASAVVGFVY